MKSEADYYDVLGVERSATEEDIRRAFRKLAMEWHPDRNKEKDAEERFKTVNEAYQVLIDPAKRQQYDRFGRAGVGGMEWPTGRGFEGAGFPGGGFGDIFDAFFGGFGVERETGPRRGADLHVTLKVTFREAIFGVAKDVEVLRTELCSLCGGKPRRGGHQARYVLQLPGERAGAPEPDGLLRPVCADRHVQRLPRRGPRGRNALPPVQRRRAGTADAPPQRPHPRRRRRRHAGAADG